MEINQLPQDKKIILFDGVCNYCNDKVIFIIKNDSKDVFRFVALQSETGQKIITYLGIDKTIDSIKYITPVTKDNVFLPKDLFVVGSINSPSDISLKENICDLTKSFCDNILNLIPKKYNFINDENKKERYGIIAQELEEFFPELVTNTEIEDTDNNVKLIKTVNYLELIPIMIVKMKNMQNEIDELKILLK